MSIATINLLYSMTLGSLGGVGATRMFSDLAETPEEDRDAIAAGAVKYQIRATYTGFDQAQDSNVGYHTWNVQIAVHAKLANPADERAWTEGINGLPLFQSTLAAPTFWKVDGVFSVTGIDFTDPPKREGNVVFFAVEAFIRTTTL